MKPFHGDHSMVQVRRCSGSSGAVSPRLCPRVSWLWKEASHHASWLMLEAGAVMLKPEIRHQGIELGEGTSLRVLSPAELRKG